MKQLVETYLGTYVGMVSKSLNQNIAVTKVHTRVCLWCALRISAHAFSTLIYLHIYKLGTFTFLAIADEYWTQSLHPETRLRRQKHQDHLHHRHFQPPNLPVLAIVFLWRS